jgi:hypothetical protein
MIPLFDQQIKILKGNKVPIWGKLNFLKALKARSNKMNIKYNMDMDTMHSCTIGEPAFTQPTKVFLITTSFIHL